MSQNLDSEKPLAEAIKLIAIDLDGTLLNDEKKVSEQTIAALRCLPADVRIVIASARPPRAVRHIYYQLGLSTWQINYNGALIWDEPNNRAVYHRPMAGDLVREMIELSRDMFEEVQITCEIMDKSHTDRADERYATETAKLFKTDFVGPYQSFCDNHVTKLILLGEPQLLAKLESMLLQKFGDKVTIVQTDDHLIQIMDQRVGKSAALRKVAAHYGVHESQIMAIGDAPNDVGMLQLAGVAVAMDNARPIVKKVADWIAPSNNDHGVHAALVRYGLCKI